MEKQSVYKPIMEDISDDEQVNFDLELVWRIFLKQ